jgi:poly-gamma-glutamate capsule biosynthesis protein CapA/YwtB (metallophosphatase superfamily)
MKLINKLIILTLVSAAGYFTIAPKIVDVKFPLAQITQNLPSQTAEGRPVELIFVGDIMLDRKVKTEIEKNNDWRWPFLRINGQLKEADIIFGNLEGPISDEGEKPDKISSFEMSPKAIEGLSYAGFNVLSVANNHTSDYGPKAFEDTLLKLKKAGIDFTGGGQDEAAAKTPLIREINGTKFSFLAYNENCTSSEKAGITTPGINCLTVDDLESFKKDVSQAKQSADIVIVSLHYGKEFTQTLSQFQVDFSKAAIDAGADLVIGHHPHVVQKYEQYKDKYIFYSLGNFVFDEDFSEETMQGLMVKTVVENKKIKSVELIKTQINNSLQVELASAVTKTTKINKTNPLISLSSNEISQGGTLLIQIKNIKNLDGISGIFNSKKINFFDLAGKFYGLAGAAAKTNPGNYYLTVNFADGSKIKKQIKILDANFKTTVLAFTPELEEKGYNATSVVQTIANNDQVKLAEAMAESAEIPYFNSSFTYPLEKMIKVGAYGSIRKSGEISLQHLGVDLDVDTGTKVYAINDGKVVGVLKLIDYGNTVVIDHGVGIFSLYLHLDEFKVSLGQKVKKDDVVGLSGNTGYSIGPHLHFSVKVNGSSVEPIEFIKTAQF